MTWQFCNCLNQPLWHNQYSKSPLQIHILSIKIGQILAQASIYNSDTWSWCFRQKHLSHMRVKETCIPPVSTTLSQKLVGPCMQKWHTDNLWDLASQHSDHSWDPTAWHSDHLWDLAAQQSGHLYTLRHNIQTACETVQHDIQTACRPCSMTFRPLVGPRSMTYRSLVDLAARHSDHL